MDIAITAIIRNSETLSPVTIVGLETVEATYITQT